MTCGESENLLQPTKSRMGVKWKTNSLCDLAYFDDYTPLSLNSSEIFSVDDNDYADESKQYFLPDLFDIESSIDDDEDNCYTYQKTLVRFLDIRYFPIFRVKMQCQNFANKFNTNNKNKKIFCSSGQNKNFVTHSVKEHSSDHFKWSEGPAFQLVYVDYFHDFSVMFPI